MAEYIFESEDEAISALGATQQPNIYDFDTEEDAIKALSGGEESSMWKRAGDVGVSLLKGAVGLPEAMTGLMDIQTLGYAGKGAEALGIKFKEAKDILDTWYTPEQQEANIKVADAKGFFPTIGAHLQNPSTIIQSIAESAPSMVGAGGIGRTIAKAGSNIMPQLAQSSGLLARTLSSPATMPIIGGAIGEGAISAGQSAEQTRQLSDTGTITPTQALTSSASGALTTLINLAGGKLAQYLGIPDLDTLMAGGGKAVVKDMAEYEAKNRLRKMAESAINEGLLQELPQSMQEQIASNLNQGKKWDEGVPEAGATGMVTGMGMGFGGGAIAPNIVRRQNTPDDMIRTWATGIKDDISNGNMTEEDVGEIKDALNRISDNEVVNRMKEALVGIEMPDGMADGISIANTLAEQEGGDAEYGQKEEMQEAEGQITPTGADIPSTTAPFMDETVSRVVPETNIDGEQGDYIGDVEKIDSGANERVEIIPPEAIIEEPLTQEIVPDVTKNIEQPIPQMLDDLTQPTPIPEDTPVVPEIKPDELIEKGTLVPQQGRTLSEKDEEMEKQADLAKPEPTPVDLPTFNSKQEKILFGLHNAEAGRREIIIDKVTGQKKTRAVKSTFPSWIPRELRKKDLIEKALVHIYDSTTPTGKVATLHGLIMDRLDNVATTIDMSEFINEDESIAREEQIEREIADEKARLTAEGITEFGEIEKSVEREISTEKIEISKKEIKRLTVDELRSKVKPDKPKQDMIGGTEDIFNLSGQEVEAENIRERIKKKEKEEKEQAAKKAEEELNKKAELFKKEGGYEKSTEQATIEGQRKLAVSVGTAGTTGRPSIRVVGQGNIPAPREIVASGQYPILDEHQRLGSNLALTHFEKSGKGFLLADGTGTGKTMQILVIAKEAANRIGKKALIVTENKQVIEGNFKQDAKLLNLDMGNIELGTYSDLRTGKIGKGDYSVVIYDEAQNLKNIESGKTLASEQVKADHKLYATATPMDRPTGASYFMSQITGIPESQIQRELGYTITTREDAEGNEYKTAELLQNTSWENVWDNIIKMRDKAIKDGSMIRREYPFYGNLEERNIELNDKQQLEQSIINNYWSGLIASTKSRIMKKNYGGQRISELSRWLEPIKVDVVMNEVMKDIKNGKSVIIMAEGVNNTNIKAINQEVPGLITLIGGKLKREGIPFASIFGTGSKSDAVKLFQENKVQVALATPKSGGTGINLDDSIGNKPRVMYVVTSNFSGDLFQQILGRVSRKMTKSPATVKMFYAENGLSDVRRKEITHKKIATLQKIQYGADLDEAYGFETPLNEKGKLIEKGLDKGKVEDVKSQYESLVKDGTVQEVETGQTPDNNISRPSTVQQRPEVISERTGSYETGTTKVSNFDDVARIAWNLVNSPEEHLISILTDQNDKVVSVHKVSKGTMNFSVAHPVTIVGQALNTPDAKNIWLAHNHPSGVSDLSNEDRTLTQILMDVALGTGVKVHGMIAISPDSYTYFGMDESGTTQESEMPMPEITVKGEVPIMERRFVKHAKGLQQIGNERDALETLRNKFGNSKGILLLNNRNMPVGSIIVQTPWMNIRGLVQRRILQEADITNANQLMAYDPTNITTLDERKNIVNFGKVTGMAVLDVFDKNGSARASGNMSAPFGTFFLKSSDLPKFTPSSSEPTKVSAWVKDFQKLLNVEGIDFKVVSSSNQFPVNVKALIKEGDVAVAVYVDGTIYINSQEIGNRTNLNQVAFHELIHAAGILKILKNNEPKLYNKAIKALDEFKAKNKDTWNTLLRDNSFNINNPVHNEMAYEELLARIAEQKPKGGLIFRIKEIIRKLLRKLGINERYSDKDIIGNLIKQSMAQARMVSEFNEMGGGEVKFSKAPPVLSKAFKEWFGNSKVVDENGKPLVVYHGTRQNFETFKPGDLGNHFGTKDQSNHVLYEAKGSNIIPVYLSLQNPIRLMDFGMFSDNAVIPQLIDRKITTENEWEKKYQKDKNWGSTENDAAVRKLLKDKGYDGVIYLNRREGLASELENAEFWDNTDKQLSDEEWKKIYKNSQDSYIAFSPNQIKSVYNRGTWSKEDDRMSFLLAGKKAKGADLTKALKFHNITKSKFQEMISYDPKGFDFSVEGFSRLVENLYSKIFMKEYPLVKFVKDVAGKEMAEEVEQSLRRFRGRSYVVKEMLDGKGVVTYGKYGDEAVQYIKGSKSLKDVLSPLENNAEYMDYESWRIAKMLTALSMHDPNYKMPDGMAQKAQEEIDRVERKYGDDIDRFIKVDKDHRQFEQYAILQPLVDVGWMSEETYKKITTSPTSQYYAALQRVIDDVGGVVGGKEPVKRRYGTTEEMDFIPSAESTISNIVKAVKLVESQKISQELVKLRNMFPAMEEVMEEKKPHYKDVQISHKAEVDPTMRKQLTDFLDKLGVSVETLNSLGRNKLGEFIIDDDRIRLMFASTEKTFAHELGHFLDKRYNLVDHFMTGSTSWSAIKKELRAIADQRADLDSSEYYKKYVRKRPEQIAEFISRYLTQPDQANALAPNAVKKLESFIYTHPELKPLLAIRPSGRKALAMSIGTIKVKSDIPPQGTIVVSKNGIKTFYSLPNDILKSIDFYKSNEMSSIIKVLSIPGRILRAGATTTIDFVFRNMIRDQFSAMVYSKYGYVPYWDFAKGIAHVLKKDDMFHEWQASGAGEAFLFSIDRLGVNTKVRDLLKNPGFRLKTFNPIEALRYISGLSEMGTRLGVYAKARNKGASTLAAMTQAREATTDFNRRGGDSAVRAISQMAAFFNANLQGMDLMRRKMFSKEGFTTKQGAKRWLKVLMGITMPSIILWAINHDDDRYKELPAWQKDLFWIIIPPGKDSTIIRIPKPFELGILFGTLPERMLSWMFDKDPKAMKEVARTIIENGFASPIPTAAVPILENITNYSFFTDRPIESTTLKNLPSGQRATTSTTEFAKLFGNVTNISPVQFENMIRGWSGSLGKKALEMVSMPLKDDIPIVDRKIIEKPWFPLPGLFARDPIGSVSDSVNNFYKIYSDVQQAYTLYRNLQKSGKTDEAKEYFDKNKQDIVMAKQARNIATMLSALRKEILAVQNSTTIDSKTKRERIDKMKTQMTKLAKMYGERYYKNNIDNS